MKKIAIITGSNDSYFSVMFGLIRSIKYLQETRKIDCFVIDVGMTKEQLLVLMKSGVYPISVDWGFSFINKEIEKSIPNHIKCLTSRPFLPKLIPGYDYYIWMDGDTWAQSDDFIGEFVSMAENSDVAIVPEVHFSYPYLYDVSAEAKRAHYQLYKESYGHDLGRVLALLPVFNAGVFAARADSRLWALWQDEMRRVISQSHHMNCDQTSLNSLIAHKTLVVGRLPAEYNWICGHALPYWDMVDRCFVTPGPLPQRIRILHVTGGALNRKDVHELVCVQGGSTQRSLLCPFPRVVADAVVD